MSIVTIVHHIQRQIIEKLTYAPSLKFSQLKPAGLESNIFTYHLRQLITQKLVEKTDDGYTLAPAGLTYVDSLSFTNLKPRKQPKLVTVIALQNETGQWLLAQRKIQPFIGRFMLINGKQHFGEAPEIHAERELQEKTGLQIPLTRRGLADIQITNSNGTLLTHVVGHVYQGKANNASLPVDMDRFHYQWCDIKTLKDTDLMPGTREVIDELVRSSQLFIASLRVSL
ncbi:MAG TPA: NUDIX hydrolase [Candidatus Saccharimonadales bacterium]|jgi:8-oxo-dGTP pyrophosphatase MutT (NUDIX family)|nr:NUDIX hydrolase [Candidatus Saccharimonadales bacterium]